MAFSAALLNQPSVPDAVMTDPDTCTLSPQWEQLVQSLTDYPDDVSRPIPLPTGFAGHGPPTQTDIGPGILVRLPLHGRWLNGDVVAFEIILWDGGDPPAIQFELDMPVERALPMLNSAGFALDAHGQRTRDQIDEVYTTTIAVDDDDLPASQSRLSCSWG